MLNRNNEFDCSKAERELGFRCRPFSESIRDTVTWLRKDGFVDATQKNEGAIFHEIFNMDRDMPGIPTMKTIKE